MIVLFVLMVAGFVAAASAFAVHEEKAMQRYYDKLYNEMMKGFQ